MKQHSKLHDVKLAVDMETIRSYAELTQDFNPIHLDPAFAAQTPLGGVIAHGTLSLCLLWKSIEDTFQDMGFDDLKLDVKFVSPVYVDDVITAGGQVRENDPARYDVWVRGQDGNSRIAGILDVPGVSKKIKEGHRET